MILTFVAIKMQNFPYKYYTFFWFQIIVCAILLLALGCYDLSIEYHDFCFSTRIFLPSCENIALVLNLLKCALCVMPYIQRISLEESRSCFHLRRKLILNLLSICCCCSVFWKPQKSKFWFHRYLISISWFKKWFSI